MTYRIYIQKHCLIFSDEPMRISGTNLDVSLYDFLNFRDIKILAEGLEKDLGACKHVWVTCVNPTVEFELLQSFYEPIVAAGGVVFNEFDEILFIHRLGKWDLPKGKVELNEAIEQAAIREVEEECGLSELVIVQKLSNTYHTYPLKGRRLFKTTHWYQMTTHKQTLIPQTAEDISQAIWADTQTIRQTMLLDTYDTLKPLLNAVLLTL